MSIDGTINLLASITLLETMVTIGLGVSVSEIADVICDWRLVSRALIVNYLIVPAATVDLLVLFHASPLVATGILIVAVCPGAPYGPPFTQIARGNFNRSIGLMVILAGSSAIITPGLLKLLLRFDWDHAFRHEHGDYLRAERRSRRGR